VRASMVAVFVQSPPLGYGRIVETALRIKSVQSRSLPAMLYPGDTSSPYSGGRQIQGQKSACFGLAQSDQCVSGSNFVDPRHRLGYPFKYFLDPVTHWPEGLTCPAGGLCWKAKPTIVPDHQNFLTFVGLNYTHDCAILTYRFMLALAGEAERTSRGVARASW
jgi:hypothetical protein